jgi:hypothetical protein
MTIANGPEIATEWIVEARGGDTCTVRVVHSWFASTDDWDSQFEQHEAGLGRVLPDPSAVSRALRRASRAPCSR